MQIPRGGSSPKQWAFARKIWSGDGHTKKEIALNSGFSPAVSNSVVSKIENKKGFQNAMYRLAAESNHLAMAIMSEFRVRGVQDFSNKDLISALNAIGIAWAKFNMHNLDEVPKDQNKNKLRTVILQRVENQTIASSSTVKKEVPPEEEEEIPSPEFIPSPLPEEEEEEVNPYDF